MAKQLQINFKRTENKKGKFKTSVNFSKVDVRLNQKPQGFFHKIDNFKKNQLQGDIPSLSKAIDSFTPTSNFETIRNLQKGIKATAKISLKSASIITNSAIKLGKAAETAEKKITNEAVKKAQRDFRQKIRSNSMDDTTKAAIGSATIIKDLYSGLKQQNDDKKFFANDKKDFFNKKAENQKLMSDNKEFLQKAKEDFLLANEDTQLKFDNFKQVQKEVDLQNKKIKKLIKEQKKELNNKKPIDSFSQGLTYTTKQAGRGIVDKALYADNSNDFLKAAQSMRMIAEMAQKKPVENKQNKKIYSLQNEVDSGQARLKERKSMFSKNNDSSLDKKLSYKDFKYEKNTLRHRLQKAKNEAEKKAVLQQFLMSSGENILKYIAALAIPIFIILLFIIILLVIIMSVVSGSEMSINTYPSYDDDLASASEYYTKLCYDFNTNVKKVSSTGSERGVPNWKTALQNLGVDISSIGANEDNPKFVWGLSEVLRYPPIYDYDQFTLYSYLCAYFYDFKRTNTKSIDDSETDPNKQTISKSDVEFWEFGGDQKEACDKIFKLEYQFEAVIQENVKSEEITDPRNGHTHTVEKKTHTIYYNVKQNKSFKECALEILGQMSNGSERITYFNMLNGNDSAWGNHQTFNSPINKGMQDIINNHLIIHNYGYDVYDWNVNHPDCSRGEKCHYGIDIKCDTGTYVEAMFNGHVDDVNTEKNYIRFTSESEKIKLWKDASRYVRVTYGNVNTGSIHKNEVFTKGQGITSVSNYKICPDMDTNQTYNGHNFLHLEMEVDYGLGIYWWEHVDPTVLIYKTKGNGNN